MAAVVLMLAMIALFLAALIRAGKAKPSETDRNSEAPAKTVYPYKPGIEFRLPNGQITTRGYAAAHPGEFAHWQAGPNHVLGENIDYGDWENWRINYYGE